MVGYKVMILSKSTIPMAQNATFMCSFVDIARATARFAASPGSSDTNTLDTLDLGFRSARMLSVRHLT